MDFLGICLEAGPSDWQVMQQTEGSAVVRLAGSWRLDPPPERVRVLARAVDEHTGRDILPWSDCRLREGNRWETELRLPAGGPYRLETGLIHEGGSWSAEWAVRGDMVHHVGVGDVFVIAGQSNASGYGKDPVSDPPELGVHMLRACGRWDIASHPLNDSTRTRFPCHRETSNPGHSPYLCFAKELQKALGHPIGLIQTALGGSLLREWCPPDGPLYVDMLRIIRAHAGKIRGVLWYQGCSDASRGTGTEAYTRQFLTLADTLRRELAQPDLPFLTVQLNRSALDGDGDDDTWGGLREAQRQAARKDGRVYVVPSTDGALSDFIHNSGRANLMLGERLAAVALHRLYGLRPAWDAPDVESAVRDGQRIILRFSHIQGGLALHAGEAAPDLFRVRDGGGVLELAGMELAGADTLCLYLKRPAQADAVIDGGYQRMPSWRLPYDAGSRLPMLSFYGVRIEAACICTQ